MPFVITVLATRELIKIVTLETTLVLMYDLESTGDIAKKLIELLLVKN